MLQYVTLEKIIYAPKPNSVSDSLNFLDVAKISSSLIFVALP